jgi:trigger factor
MSKKTKEDIENEAKEQAYKNAKNAYVLDKIGIVEEINVTESEVNAKLEVFAKQYNTSIEEVKKQLGNQFTNFVLNVRQEKIIKFVTENNNI